METNENRGIAYAWFCVGLLVGIVMTASFLNAYWKADAVDKGYAEYNSANGKWQWRSKDKVWNGSRF